MKRHATAVLALVLNAGFAGAASLGDDFNDNRLDPRKWGSDEKYGHGKLTEKNQRLEYTCAGGTSEDDLIRRWRAGNGPYDRDWEMQMDVFNSTTFTPGSTDENNSFGIKLRGPSDDDQEIYVEQYHSQLFGPPMRKGFDAAFDTPEQPDVYVDAAVASGNAGAVRMAFNSTTKVVTVYYDLDPSDGYQVGPVWFVRGGRFGRRGRERRLGNVGCQPVPHLCVRLLDGNGRGIR